MRAMLRWISRLWARPPAVPCWAMDRAGWLDCYNHGHIGVNEIDGWFCPVCWTAFFMGSPFPCGERFKAKVLSGEILITRDECGSWHYHDKQWVGPETQTYTRDEVLAMGPRQTPTKDGGPPYVFEVRRAR